MGLLRWFRARRAPDPKRPWVRPEFLGLFALLMVGGAAVAFFASGSPDHASAPPAASTQKDFAGITPAAALQCAPDCNAEGLYYLWTLDHPDAKVLEKNPVYYRGILIGYDIVYTED